MSAFDITGAVIGSILAWFFWVAAIVPNKPPEPKYGAPEAVAAVTALLMSAWAIFCVSRMAGAHL